MPIQLRDGNYMITGSKHMILRDGKTVEQAQAIIYNYTNHMDYFDYDWLFDVYLKQSRKLTLQKNEIRSCSTKGKKQNALINSNIDSRFRNEELVIQSYQHPPSQGINVYTQSSFHHYVDTWKKVDDETHKHKTEYHLSQNDIHVAETEDRISKKCDVVDGYTQSSVCSMHHALTQSDICDTKNTYSQCDSFNTNDSFSQTIKYNVAERQQGVLQESKIGVKNVAENLSFGYLSFVAKLFILIGLLLIFPLLKLFTIMHWIARKSTNLLKIILRKLFFPFTCIYLLGIFNLKNIREKISRVISSFKSDTKSISENETIIEKHTNQVEKPVIIDRIGPKRVTRANLRNVLDQRVKGRVDNRIKNQTYATFNEVVKGNKQATKQEVDRVEKEINKTQKGKFKLLGIMNIFLGLTRHIWKNKSEGLRNKVNVEVKNPKLYNRTKIHDAKRVADQRQNSKVQGRFTTFDIVGRAFKILRTVAMLLLVTILLAQKYNSPRFQEISHNPILPKDLDQSSSIIFHLHKGMYTDSKLRKTLLQTQERIVVSVNMNRNVYSEEMFSFLNKVTELHSVIIWTEESSWAEAWVTILNKHGIKAKGLVLEQSTKQEKVHELRSNECYEYHCMRRLKCYTRREGSDYEKSVNSCIMAVMYQGDFKR